MEDETVLSTTSISNFISVSNFLMILTIIFGILSVWIVFKYSTRSMKEYKFYLLNMVFTIFLSDMCFHLICRPYMLYPVMGVCMLGTLEGPLIAVFGIDGAMKIMFVILFFCVVSSIASITNATLHRFYLTSKMGTQTNGLLSNKRVLCFIMIVLELIWPIVASLLCLQTELRPEYAIQENLAINAKITQQTFYHACFLSSYDLLSVAKTIYPSILGFLHGAICALGSILVVFLSWKKIGQAKKRSVSPKTLAMEKQLMISVGIQALTPNIIFLVILLVFLLWFVIENTWMGVIGSFVFRVGSLHTIMNFSIMVYTIPAFSRGISRDFRRLICCKKTTTVTPWVTRTSSWI